MLSITQEQCREAFNLNRRVRDNNSIYWMLQNKRISGTFDMDGSWDAGTFDEWCKDRFHEKMWITQ